MSIGTSRFNSSSPNPESGRKYFGGADYSYARQTGSTNRQILNWINSNMGLLSPGAANQPGGGGLYDRIQQGADSEGNVDADRAKKAAETAARQRELDTIQRGFDDKMLALQNTMKAQSTMYENNLNTMKNTLTAQLNPQTRESVLGVKGASDTSNTAKLNRQGMKGSFARTGLRIKSLNV